MATLINRCAVDINMLTAINVAREFLRLPASVINADQNMVLSSVIAAAFGGHKPLRPWTISREDGIKVTIIGNGSLDELQAALDMAAPDAQEAIIGLRAVPSIEINEGKVYRLRTRVCPVQRVTNQGSRRIEADVFRAAIVKKPEGAHLTREYIYPRWLASKLDGAETRQARLDSFCLAKMFRAAGTERSTWAELRYPDSRLSALIKVMDEEKFANVVRSGVGRQRVYGYGWLWLQEVA